MSLGKSKRTHHDSAHKSSSGGLRSRILFVLFALFIYRVGTYIPLPGVNVVVMDQIAQQQSNGLLGMFNMFTGGALGRMSLFSLNIMPYITASIVMQLLTVISHGMNALKKEGDIGRKKIDRYTKYLTVLLALTQGYGIAVGIESMSTLESQVILNPGWSFKLTAVLSLLGGTMFAVWLGERITSCNLGNGSSLIIFTGIVSGLPSAVIALFEMGRTGVLSLAVIIFVILIATAMVISIIAFERAQRRVTVQYPKRQIGNKIYMGDSTHLPLKLNTAGVIPPIFASSILLFPMTVLSYSGSSDYEILRVVAANLSHGKPIYILLYVAMIFFFSFFYTAVISNPDDTAENLRKNGAVILGYRPGKSTANYIDYILTRLTLVGATYISFICIVPEILMTKYGVPFYLGGTSLLIVINVVMDIFTKIQAHLLTIQYQHLLNKKNHKISIR